jgi:phage terminase large subunit GpA-like protein
MHASNYQIRLGNPAHPGVKALRNAFAAGLEPPPELMLDQWADEHRKLPRESSSEHGQWRTSRFPFLQKIMQDLSPQSKWQEVAVMKGAQLGFTEVALNLLLYNIGYHPVPMLYVQKTLGAIEKFSKQRFGPSIKAMPEIEEQLGQQRGRDSSDTMLLKTFAGGVIILGGANSAASLRSMPIGALVLDEWDSFEQDIQGEGDPAELAIRRTANFPRRKIFYLSTPKTKETSRIEPAFEAGTQEYYEVPCPHCGKLQKVEWPNIKFEHTGLKIHKVYLQCVHCNEEILERHKTWMFDPANGAQWVSYNPDGAYPSYHINSLYSPLGFYSWRDAVKLFLKANTTFDKDLLKVFVNTVLGETWSETSRTVEAAGLLTHRSIYPAPAPHGVMVCTAGVDVQEERIEAEIVGWGRNQESWSIDYGVFRGDTELTFVWEQLDDFLMQNFEHEAGGRINIACAAVDSGHRARTVYRFCKVRHHRNVFAIKGVAGWGKGYINRPTRKNKDGIFLFNAYVDELKSKVYSTLRVTEAGAGYCHFPLREDVYDTQYFKMLTAERLQTRKVRGFTKLEWVLAKGRRNEALDCRAYALSALNILNPNFDMIAQRGGKMSLTNNKARKRGRVLSTGL